MEAITTVKHPALQRARRLSTASGRAQAGQFLIEGESMLRQALAARAGVADVFFLEGAQVEPTLGTALAQASANVYRLGRGLLGKLLGTGYDTAVTVVGVATMRQACLEAVATRGGPLLVGEGIQDPRNVGVLVRTAEAGGAQGLILSTDSADPFSRAAVRSSTGSLLRLPLVISDDLGQDLMRLRECGLRIIATSARRSTPVGQAQLDRRCAIIVGNESAGVSLTVRELADDLVSIPVAGGASSFNVTVAAGILLYECGRG